MPEGDITTTANRSWSGGGDRDRGDWNRGDRDGRGGGHDWNRGDRDRDHDWNRNRGGWDRDWDRRRHIPVRHTWPTPVRYHYKRRRYNAPYNRTWWWPYWNQWVAPIINPITSWFWPYPIAGSPYPSQVIPGTYW